MSKRTSLIVFIVGFAVAVAVVWFGGGWLWHALLRMHGVK